MSLLSTDARTEFEDRAWILKTEFAISNILKKYRRRRLQYGRMNLTLALQRLSIYWESLTLVEEAAAINSCRSPANRGSSCFITTPLWWERRMPQTFRIADNVSVRCFLNPQQPTHLPRSVWGCTLRPKKCLSSNTIPVAGEGLSQTLGTPLIQNSTKLPRQGRSGNTPLQSN